MRHQAAAIHLTRTFIPKAAIKQSIKQSICSGRSSDFASFSCGLPVSGETVAYAQRIDDEAYSIG